MEPSGGTSRSHVVAWALIGVTLVLVFVLFQQGLDVYFLATDDPTAAQASRYVWTASACVASAVAAVIAAMIAGKRGAGVTCVFTLILALGAALVFSVPQDRFRPKPEQYPLPDNYEPCYSGSGKCN